MRDRSFVRVAVSSALVAAGGCAGGDGASSDGNVRGTTEEPVVVEQTQPDEVAEIELDLGNR
jgi:hypothetical protein